MIRREKLSCCKAFVGSPEGTPMEQSYPLRMFYACILRSHKDGIYYSGSCNDLKSRIKEHNAGKVRFTNGHRPWDIHFYEEYTSRSEAYKRERYFKTISCYNWLKENGII